MKRGEYCAHLRPDYDRLEVAHHIKRDPVTDEISWPPTNMEDELKRLGLWAEAENDIEKDIDNELADMLERAAEEAWRHNMED